jgi:hypothetical protein
MLKDTMQPLHPLVFPEYESETEFIELVKQLPRGQSLRLFSNLSALMWNAWESDDPGAIAASQIEAAKAFASAGSIEGIARALSDGLIFVYPEQTALAVKFALLYAAADDVPADGSLTLVFTENALEVLLRLSTLMQADEDARALTDEGARNWSLRVGSFQISENYRDLLARYANLFRWSETADARASTEWLDLNADFPRLLNIGIDEYFAAFMLIYSRVGLLKTLADTLMLSAVFSPSQFLAGTEDTRSIEQVLANNAIDEAEFVSLFPPDDPNRWSAISLLPLWNKPFIRLQDGYYCIASPKYVQNASGTGIFHQLADAYWREGGDKTRGRFTSFFGNYLEAYVAQLMNESALAPARTVLREVDYSVGKLTHKSTDVVVREGRRLVLLEVVAKRLNAFRSLRDLDTDAITKDLNQMVVNKAAEISNRVADFENGHYSFDDITIDDVDDIFPVVVILEPLLAQFGLAVTIEAELVTRGKLGDTNALQVIDIESLEAVQRTLQSGALLSDILTAKLAHPMSAAERLKDFLIANRYEVEPTAQASERFAVVLTWVQECARRWGVPASSDETAP